MIEQLQQFGETRRGWLGVRIQQVTDEIAESLNIKPPHGALVAGIDDKGPAKPAGIEAGDVIIKFDGKDIKEMRDLPRVVADTPVGKDVEVIDHPQGPGDDQVGHARPPRGRREAGGGRQARSTAASRSRRCKKTLGLDLANMSDDLRSAIQGQGQRQGRGHRRRRRGLAGQQRSISTPGDVIVEVAQEAVQAPTTFRPSSTSSSATASRRRCCWSRAPTVSLRFVALSLK